MNKEELTNRESESKATKMERFFIASAIVLGVAWILFHAINIIFKLSINL